MQSVNFRCYSSLLQLALLIVMLIGLFFFFDQDLLFIFQNDSTRHLGLVLSSIIVILFFIGLFRLLILLLEQIREQNALQSYLDHVQSGHEQHLSFASNSMIGRRYQNVNILFSQHSSVDQATLAVNEMTIQESKLTIVRFVSSTLILIGVFGTVVSLSYALMGAHDLVNDVGKINHMGAIIGSMSTALNTTIVAIICYVIFTYFYFRVRDSRNQLLANLEIITTLYLLSGLNRTESSLISQASELIAGLQQASHRLAESQQNVNALMNAMNTHLNTMAETIENNRQHNQAIVDTLRAGFRLDQH